MHAFWLDFSKNACISLLHPKCMHLGPLAKMHAFSDSLPKMHAFPRGGRDSFHKYALGSLY
jgi:hypothetical protein